MSTDSYRGSSSQESRDHANALVAEVLRGRKLPPAAMLELASRLKAEKAFSQARQILARARMEPGLNHDRQLKLRIHQESALCTYKDEELPADLRLNLALEILREAEDFATTTNQETLGLIGGVYKRKWEVDGQQQHLEQALMFYKRGYQQGAAHDQGYTGINAAFLLDLLAGQELDRSKESGSSPESAPLRRSEARRIREDIVRTVAPLIDQPGMEWLSRMWWFYSTVAEALFGLNRYDEGVAWLRRGRDGIGMVPEWEYEATVRQLAHLAILQSDSSENTPAWNALEAFLGKQAAAVRTAFLGKIGLALSGGGFRASLYHIGVLAKLAELDLLRHVEVLSCVSGGSIVGAHYYLELRALLQSKAGDEITRQDYIDIVRRLQRDFLAGVQRNIRTRVAAEFVTNVSMALRADYTRTQRAGELFERELYSRVADGHGREPRWLNELFIKPLGEPPDFSPKIHNWRRTAKVPILILNATTLNTGHTWQFTASWMGETPAGISTEIDGNDYLRRMYYTEAPKRHRFIRLGYAVAASACVPGIFEPLILSDLYPERVVRLVDGGVCDNQGVGGLLEQDCTVVLVSDGSGQMESQNNPSGSVIGVPLRSNSILQSRVREAQYRELEARRRASLLRGLMFVHLKKDLDVDPVDWVDSLDPHDASAEARPSSRKGLLTRYGIAKDIQRSLSAVRTDLDSFSDAEAFALMTSGYRMTEWEFDNSRCIDGFTAARNPVAWEFLGIENAMKGAGKQYESLRELLGASKLAAFKVWRLYTSLSVLAVILGLSAAALTVAATYRYSEYALIPPVTAGQAGQWAGGLILMLLLTNIVGKRIVKAARWRDALQRTLFIIGMSLAGWLLARIHLVVFDRLFLRRGRIL